jgi:hypothetical protein
MNKTTGADTTALSIALRIPSDNKRVCRKERDTRGRSVVCDAEGLSAAAAPRKACHRQLTVLLVLVGDLTDSLNDVASMLVIPVVFL